MHCHLEGTCWGGTAETPAPWGLTSPTRPTTADIALLLLPIRAGSSSSRGRKGGDASLGLLLRLSKQHRDVQSAGPRDQQSGGRR